MGNSATKQKIAQTRDYLFASRLVESEKDGLLDQLNAADAAIEEDTSALCDLIAQRVCAEVKQAVRLPSMIREIVKAEVELHRASCALLATPAGKIGIFLQLAKSWPLGIAVAALAFSPHLPAILNTLLEKFAK